MNRRLAEAAAAALVSAALLSGCAGVAATETACEPYQHGVVLVIGAHANQPRPDLTSQIACRLEATIAAEQSVAIVAVDGEPRVLSAAQVRPIEGGNAAARANAVRRHLAEVIAIVQGATPQVGGADLLGALVLATEVAQGSGQPITDLVVVDSGLSDTGLDLTRPGGTLMDAGDVAAHLFAERALREDHFAGLRVEFWGLCEVRDPQPRLSLRQCDAIRALWPRLVDAALGEGSSVVFPRSGEPIAGAPPVAIAEVLEPAPFTPETGSTLSFGEASDLAFVSDRAELIDPAAARRALEPVAEWLLADSARHAEVVGRTSSADPERNAALSLARAEVCRELLLALGVAPGQVTAIGAGYTADPPDRRPDGSLDPIAAAANRVTEVRLSA